MAGDTDQEVSPVIAGFVQQRGFLVIFAILDFILGVGGAFLNGKRLLIINLIPVLHSDFLQQNQSMSFF